jgi:hypothetical protein
MEQAGREAAQQSANSEKPDYTIRIATGLLERSTAFGMKTAQWKTGFQALKTEGLNSALLQSSGGTVIHLKVIRDGIARSVALTLKELVP